MGTGLCLHGKKNKCLEVDDCNVNVDLTSYFRFALPVLNLTILFYIAHTKKCSLY